MAGDSLIDGRVVLHLEGEVPPEVLGEAGEGIESLWVRYSVGFDDHLLYGSEIRMTDDEEYCYDGHLPFLRLREGSRYPDARDCC